MSQPGSANGESVYPFVDTDGVVLNCLGCGREVLLPYITEEGGRQMMVSIAPIEGWTAPPLLCPECSPKGVRSGATASQSGSTD